MSMPPVQYIENLLDFPFNLGGNTLPWISMAELGEGDSSTAFIAIV